MTRRLAPLCWALLAVLVHGYRFGSTDQVVQLTLVREALVPGGLAGDLVADHAASHPSVLWRLGAVCVRLVGWESLPLLAALVWLAGLLAWFFGVDALARTLWPGASHRWAGLLVVGMPWLPGHHAWFEHTLVARTAAAPLLLWAVVWALRTRWGPAALLAALGIAAHGTTGTQALTLLLALALQGRDRNAWPLVLPLAAVLMLGGRAELGWMDVEWWAVVSWRLGHHVDPSTWPVTWWLAAVLQLGIAVWAAVRTPRLWPFVGVGLLWAAAATVGALGLRWAPLVQSHGWYAWSWLGLAGALGVLPHLRRSARSALLVLLVWVQVPRSVLGIVPERGLQVGWPVVREQAEVWELPWRRVLEGVPAEVHTKDGGEVVLSRAFALAWRDRLEARCGPIPLQEQGDPRGYTRAATWAKGACPPIR